MAKCKHEITTIENVRFGYVEFCCECKEVVSVKKWKDT